MDLVTYFQDMWQLATQGKPQGIWFWSSFYVFIVCVYSLIFQIRTRYWPFTEGELVESAVEKFGATDWVKSNQDERKASLSKNS